MHKNNGVPSRCYVKRDGRLLPATLVEKGRLFWRVVYDDDTTEWVAIGSIVQQKPIDTGLFEQSRG